MDIQMRDNVAIVTLPLEKLDLSTASDFQRMMNEIIATHQKIVLNMERIIFVDSSGLGKLLAVLRDLSANGGDMKLFGVQKRVRVMFELVRMHRILGLFETSEEAIQAFAQNPTKE